MSAFVLALASFGFVGAVFAGLSVPGAIDCGYKGYHCVNGYDWEVWYQCSSDWEDNGTDVSLGDERATLIAEEHDGGYGDCQMAITDMEGDDDITVYNVGCSLPAKKGGKSGGGGNGGNVSLTIRNLGPVECP